jgi:hypothetical protein
MNIVKKGTPEFEKAQEDFIECFSKKNPESSIIERPIGMGTTLNRNLPMPFGCPDLSIYIWDDGKKITGIGFFCHRLGCICSPARSDMEETYPSYCPDPGELLYQDEDWEDEEDYDYD